MVSQADRLLFRRGGRGRGSGAAPERDFDFRHGGRRRVLAGDGVLAGQKVSTRCLRSRARCRRNGLPGSARRSRPRWPPRTPAGSCTGMSSQATPWVTNDDGAKLTDFGISIWCEVTRTEAGTICGTPANTAPEVARGRPATQASDVFSLGATLFAAVEGAPPAGTGHPDVVLERARRAEVSPTRRAGSLAPLLREMLDPSPVRRPSASEVRSRLMEFVGDSQSSSPLPGGTPVGVRVLASPALPGGRRGAWRSPLLSRPSPR